MAAFGAFFNNGMLLLAGIAVCGDLQAEENKRQPSTKCLETLTSNSSDISGGSLYLYGGMSLVASNINSNFKMDYEVNKTNFPDARSHVNHKEGNLRKIGIGVIAGIQAHLNENFFLAIEGTFTHGTTRHQRDFTQAEDTEINGDDDSDQKISHINIEHKNELGLLLKVGPRVTPYGFYGIFGFSTKQVKIGYELDSRHDVIFSTYSKCPKARVFGPVVGFGITRTINKQLSGALEYKYKIYNRAKTNLLVDDSVFGSADIRHDISVRDLECNSKKHELSLSIAVRTAI